MDNFTTIREVLETFAEEENYEDYIVTIVNDALYSRINTGEPDEMQQNVFSKSVLGMHMGITRAIEGTPKWVMELPCVNNVVDEGMCSVILFAEVGEEIPYETPKTLGEAIERAIADRYIKFFVFEVYDYDGYDAFYDLPEDERTMERFKALRLFTASNSEEAKKTIPSNMLDMPFVTSVDDYEVEVCTVFVSKNRYF